MLEVEVVFKEEEQAVLSSNSTSDIHQIPCSSSSSSLNYTSTSNTHQITCAAPL